MNALGATSLALCALAAAGNAPAQTYPAKPIRLVVPYPPGGSNDVLSRITAQTMSPGLGQPVIVENRSGAGGMIGADHVAKSAPDGYSLVNVQASFTANAALRPKMAYDPIGGHTQMVMTSLPSAMNQVQAGRLKALAVGSEKRSSFMPEMPTISESGVPGYFAEFWWGIAAPARTPDNAISRLAGELTRALQSAELKRRFAAEGAEPSVMAREQFTRFVANEITRWRKVAQEANIQPE